MRARELSIIFIFILIPLNSFSVITESKAEKIIQRLDDLYKADKHTVELLEKFNRKMNILYMPDDEFVFGFKGVWGRANNSGEIFIAGGARKNLFFTEETFLALVCHEIGHLLGGWPNGTFLLSYEGQADYYAANICMKKYYLKHLTSLKEKTYIHQYYFDLCNNKYPSKIEARICAKTMQGGLNLAIASALSIEEILLPGPAVQEHYETPETLEGRDSPQCISDTFEAGALCDLDPSRNIEIDSKRDQFCSNRPKCWFKE